MVNISTGLSLSATLLIEYSPLGFISEIFYWKGEISDRSQTLRS